MEISIECLWRFRSATSGAKVVGEIVSAFLVVELMMSQVTRRSDSWSSQATTQVAIAKVDDGH